MTTATTLREQIVAAARAYVGVRFRHQQRSRAGMDCVGLIVCVAADCGFELEDYRHYPPMSRGREMLPRTQAQLVPGERQDGSIVLFRVPTHLDFPTHAGIITDYGVVHAFQGVGKVAEHRLDHKWLKRVHSYWDYKEVVN